MSQQTSVRRVLFARIPRLAVLSLTGVFLLMSLLASLRTPARVDAATANTINFQARLENTSGAIAPDGTYNVEFKLYNSSSSSGSSQGSCTGDSSCLWTETRTGAARVQVTNGYLTVNLGSVTAFPAGVNWDQQLWLTMNIGGTGSTASWDGEMNPRLALTAVPYAFSAGQLQTSSGSYSNTLNIQAPTGGSQVFQIQNQGAAGTYNLLTAPSGSDGYVKLQGSTPGTQQTGNLNISGTAIASSLQAGSFDTSSSATLSIGTSNASGITIGKQGTAITAYGAIQLSGTTANANAKLQLSGTLNSTSTTYQYGFQNQLNFTPQAAVTGAVQGMLNTANLTGSSYNVNTLTGSATGISTDSGYTGTVSNGTSLSINSPTIGGSNLFTNYTGVQINSNTVNGSNTSGTITNQQLYVGGTTAAAASGGTVNNYGINIVQPAGSGAGTTNNYGLYIQGNGGGSTNYSIFNASTATSYFTGNIVSANNIFAGTFDTAGSNTLNIGAGNASTINFGVSGTTDTFNATGNFQQAINIIGNFTTTANARLYIAGTINSSSTSYQYGSQEAVNFNPSGASLSGIFGITNNPTISGSSLAIPTFMAETANVSTAAGFTGTVSTATVYNAADASINGSNKFTNFIEFKGAAISANSGNTSGTISNYGLQLNGSTAAAGSGGTLNNYGAYITQPSGSGAGTTNNYGLYIQGNGGGSSNYSIYNSSTASSYFAGSIASAGTLQGATVNATSGYQINGTAGASTTCTSGNVLSNIVVSGGIVTGGTCAASGGTTTLQSAYTNSSSPATIAETSGKGVAIQDYSTTVGNIFAIQNSGGTTNYLAVTNGGVAVIGSGSFSTGLNVGGQTVFNTSGVLQNAALASSYTNITSLANLTTVGALTSGSIASGFGTISTGSAIGTTAALSGGTLGIGSSSQLSVDASGNVTTSGTITGSSLDTTASGNLSLGSANASSINLGGGTANQTLNIGNSSGNDTVNIATGGGADTINIGNSGDAVNVGSNLTASGTVTVGGVTVFNTSGVLQNAALASSYTNITSLANLNTVGTLTSGYIGSGFGTILTGNTITGTTLNGTAGVNTGTGAGVQRIDASGNLYNIASINTTTGGSILTTNIGTLQRTTTGGSTTVIDLNDSSTTTLQLKNSGTGVANFNLYGGSLTTGSTTPTTRIDNSGNFTAASITNSGNFTSNGTALFQTTTNSTTAFQVQNASGVPIFLVDTSTGVNYLTYGGFEAGSTTPTGWNVMGSPTTFSRNTTRANTYQGAASVRLTTTATSGQGMSTTSFTSTVPTGAVYISFYAMLASGSGNSSLFTVTSTDGTTHTCVVGSTTLMTTGFQRVGCTLTTTGAMTNLQIATNAATAIDVYIDAVQVATGTTPAPYAANGAIQLRGTINSPVLLQNVSNSTSAFQIANASGATMFTADTLNNAIDIGTPGTTSTLLVIDSDTDAAFSAGVATNTSTEVDGAMFYSTTNHNFMCGVAGSWQTCTGLLYSNTAVSSALTSCTTACAAFGLSAPIPANYCKPGRVIRVQARGIWTATTSTLTFGLYYGTNATTAGSASNVQVGGTTTTMATTVTATNSVWSLDYTLVCFSTTTINGQGFALMPGTTSASTVQMAASIAGATVATTTAKNLYIFPTEGATGNSATLQQLIVTGY